MSGPRSALRTKSNTVTINALWYATDASGNAIGGISPTRITVPGSGLAELVEYGSRLADDQTKLSTRFGELTDVIREANYYASADVVDLVTAVHVRKAIDPILKCLRESRVRGAIGGIAHAFNGSREQAEAFIKLGFKLGFGGAMTFEGSKRIRELAATLPLDSIVLETDAPDIPPAWKNGGRNTPADLLPIAETLAKLRHLSLAEVAAATTQNARAVLPRLNNLKPTTGENP